MFLKLSLLLFFASCVYPRVNAQTCTTLGQNPSSAFPVCGTATFIQETVPYCGGKRIPGPCSVDDVVDTNPFWYKFTCYSAGTLGFTITPNDLNDDYDWQLFDITGFDVNEIYTNTALFVACNWSGNQGLTGASSAGRSLQNCAGYAYPTFSSMPILKAGHNYLLLVSHFTLYTPSQDGYKLTFNGGSASITDTLLPDMVNAKSSCDATRVTVKLNKKMKCGSLAPDGSDFSITSAAATITGVAGIGCNTGFDMDSLVLTLSNPLPPGNYTVAIKNGVDGNSLVDNCDRNIAPGTDVPLVVAPIEPTAMDSIAVVKCAPQSLQLIFSNPIRCNTIALDGSDFVVTGSALVTIVSARGNCTNGLSNVINIDLSGAIVSQGNYQITLKQGSDGNTILDECGLETPAGSVLLFTTRDTLSAAFTYQIFTGCKIDTLIFAPAGNGIDQWLWNLDTEGTSTQQNPVAYFKTFGPKQITLIVSNGVCNDTVSRTLISGSELNADFEATNSLCPEDAAVFTNKSTGAIKNYYWDLGNGNTSTLETPPQLHYPILSAEKIYPLSLVIEGASGCFDTAFSTVKVLKSCYIAVPNAFTPNSDGLNDYLYPVNAYKADDLEFSVYNRIGERVFYTKDKEKKWDGKIKENPQDSGVYVWTLKYMHHDTGKKVFQKGNSILIR